MKLLSFWWLKANNLCLTFDFNHWWVNPLLLGGLNRVPALFHVRCYILLYDFYCSEFSPCTPCAGMNRFSGI